MLKSLGKSFKRIGKALFSSKAKESELIILQNADEQTKISEEFKETMVEVSKTVNQFGVTAEKANAIITTINEITEANNTNVSDFQIESPFEEEIEKLFEDEPQLGNESAVFVNASPIVDVSPFNFNRKLYWRKKKSQRKRGLK